MVKTTRLHLLLGLRGQKQRDRSDSRAITSPVEGKESEGKGNVETCRQVASERMPR